MSKKDFRFFVPVEIEKAKDKTGKEVMKIAGVASTADRDSDGEVLDPSGFDLSYFLNNGFINWHHQAKNKPNAIIGEPTVAEIKDGGLYVEGLLYPESNLAKEVYELAKGLEKSGSKRRLGFSIEGKVLERDSLDERFVKKAKITGLAVTPTPKNANTIVDIIKGNFNEIEKDEILQFEGTKANGGTQNIIDITKPNGDRVVVDNSYNIKVISKGTDTSNAGVLSPESVDKKVKEQEKLTKGTISNDNLPKFAKLNKSQVFSELIKATGNLEDTKKILKAINFKEMSKTVSIDELSKALNEIGVPVNEEILKAADSADIEDEIENEDKDKSTEAEVKPAKKDKDKEDDPDKDKTSVEDLKKSLSEKEGELEIIKSKLAELEKSEDAEPAKADEVEKGEEPEIGEPKYKAELEKATQGFEKGISDIKDLFTGFKKSIDERFEALENSTPGRKSAPTARVIEKSFGGAEDKNNEGKTKISLSRQRQDVSNILLAKSGIEKGEVNDFYSNAMMQFEATGQLSKAVATDLYTNSDILITE